MTAQAMGSTPTRRQALGILGAAALASGAAPLFAQARGKVVIVGGGFGGAGAARYLRRFAPGLEVTLVEPAAAFVTCPFSNAVIGGLAGIESVTHSYAGLEAAGVQHIRQRADALDLDGRTVRLADGSALPWDRLIVSPGIDFKTEGVEGYGATTPEVMPHAWKAGPQTLLLRRQLEEMEDGGVVVMTIPPNPYRCPPGPYERASLIAHYLQSAKPRSKLILLDGKDNFSKQGLFQAGWEALYPGLIDWVPFAEAGSLLAVDAATLTVETEFASQRGDVVNVIPPQRAAAIVRDAGLSAGQDWCEVDQATFESKLAPGVHVLGDAAIAGAMPKAGFAASNQAKLCALVVAALQSDQPPPAPHLINTCYSLVGPDYGISVVDVFTLGADHSLTAVPGAGGLSPMEADAGFRQREARAARDWYAAIIREIWG